MTLTIDLTTDEGRAEYERFRASRASKYNAQKVPLDGFVFDSIAESERYGELKLMERAGIISGLVVHPKFVLQEKFVHNGKTVREITYEADFRYVECGTIVVEDVKSTATRTRVYRNKAKQFKRIYGHMCEFREVVR